MAPSYFHEVYKVEFINFLKSKKIDEASWYSQSQTQKDDLYSDYVVESRHQKELEELRNRAEKAEKEREQERERAEKERLEKEIERERAERYK